MDDLSEYEPKSDENRAAGGVSSFGTRAMNVFMSPAEVFGEVASAPVQNSSWVMPLVLLMVVSVLAVFAIMNNPALLDQALEPQRAGMQKSVAAGEMTQEQADQAEQFMSSPALFLGFGSGAAIMFVCAMMFLSPLAIMLTMKLVLTAGAPYKKTLEIYGLASLIAVPGTLVSLLMMSMMNSMLAQPGLSLAVMENFDRESFMHNVLASVNIFSVWQMAVLGIGIGKAVGAESSRGMMISFGLWVVWLVCSSLLGWGGR